MFLQKIKQQERNKISKIEASSGLSDDEIKKMKEEAEANADADNKAKETADKVNAADAMIFQTEKQLKEFGDKLSPEKKTPIEDALKDLKESFEKKDLPSIDASMEKINEAWKAASEEMYKATEEQKKSQNPEQSNKEGSDDVTDVDFEEVKE